MSALRDRLAEDKLARDAAKAIALADYHRVKADLAARGVGGRIADTVSEEAAELGEEVIQMAEENKAVVGGVVAALVLWLARGPIGRLLGWDETEERD
ncbi:hypothetical protein T8S45_03510 [Blastomonas marina]|jgi:hypothetical protein|uniref:DUF3618 domain-containing protein n=1 Tax=Blastomonas marina TaxID=1867408 RepID=A0ABQ1F9C1_9SPHN|nr:hypothetical protein [Blastomonas marina]WPZ04621.1 hypothetical protein T8S45_03510 [Blastomonas marina]GGA03154.1 hypothetical protein GCM10010923_09990 [Blastomonas marina]